MHCVLALIVLVLKSSVGTQNKNLDCCLTLDALSFQVVRSNLRVRLGDVVSVHQVCDHRPLVFPLINAENVGSKHVRIGCCVEVFT